MNTGYAKFCGDCVRFCKFSLKKIISMAILIDKVEFSTVNPALSESGGLKLPAKEEKKGRASKS